MKKTPSQVINDNYKVGEILKEGMEDNKKMRVIDLLVKIANGEEVPKTILYNGEIREYNDEDKDYTSNIGELYLFCDVLTSGSGEELKRKLNKVVKVVEEDPKDEEIVEWSNIAIREMKKAENLSEIKAYIETIMRTQNEIIEKIETLD